MQSPEYRSSNYGERYSILFFKELNLNQTLFELIVYLKLFGVKSAAFLKVNLLEMGLFHQKYQNNKMATIQRPFIREARAMQYGCSR